MGFSKQEYWSGVPLPSPRGAREGFPKKMTELKEKEESNLATWIRRKVKVFQAEETARANDLWQQTGLPPESECF